MASAVVRRALELLRDQGADFALLVCEPALIPFYERIGWTPYEGGLLLVRQHGEAVEFTFNRPMVHPLREATLPDGVIDLLGPPW
jgi:hypothetical protein